MNELTITNIIKLLRQSGINSKKLVIDRLMHPSLDDLITLKRDVKVRISMKKLDKKEK